MNIYSKTTSNLADKADKVHTHVISDVIGLPDRLSDIEFALYIRTLFMRGEKGFWADPSDTYTLFQDADGTVAAADGDPIGLVLDKTGNNYNLTQTVSASRPKLLNGGIVFDKVDDALTLTVPAGGITGTLFLATTRGTASYGVSMPEGEWTLGNVYNPLGDVVSAVLVDRELTETEKARLHVFGVGKGGTEFGVETSFYAAYRLWDHLVDFPMIDTSKGTNFLGTWHSCSGLTSFPLLDVSSGTSFYGAWTNCKGLTSFPLLDVSSGTNFSYSWRDCSGLTSFPLLNVSSGTTFSYAWQYCSGLTSFPSLDVSSGTNFTGTWSHCSSLTSFPELDVSSGTEFTYAWYNCSGLTSFPSLDVSSGTNFSSTWRGCSGLTSFPELNVSNCTTFYTAWYGCSSLTSFPANFFDNCLATDFTNTFYSTNLSQESIDGILVSINSNATSNGTFDQSGGSAPSIVGQAAIDEMRARGWTITVTGGY